MDEEGEEEGDDVAPRPQVPALTPPQRMSYKVLFSEDESKWRCHKNVVCKHLNKSQLWKRVKGRGEAHPLPHAITLNSLMTTCPFISYSVIIFMLSRYILNGKIYCKMAKQILF